MKVIWEEKDLFVGRRIQKLDSGPINSDWIVGYDPKLPESQRYGILSMDDGMFNRIGTLIDVVKFLNDCENFLPSELMPVPE